MKRIALLLALLVSLGVAGSASATPDHEKVALCHRTASDSNPYVFIEVDPASLPAHLNNLPGHPQKHGRDDFLPSQWQIENKTCGERDTKGPELDAQIFICGDPRALVYLTNTGDKGAYVQLNFTSAATGERKHVDIWVPVGQKVVKRWVLGQTGVNVKYEGERIARAFVNKQSNIGACPR